MSELPPTEQLPAAPLLVGAYVFVLVALFAVRRVHRQARRRGAAGSGSARRRAQGAVAFLMPTAAHFLYIPGVLLVGIVIGWMLGSRAAADAYASQMKKAAAKVKRDAERNS